MDPHLRLRTSPIARPDAVVQGDRFRITVLTAGLLRIEWADDGVFEDRASTFALHRDLPVPDFEVVDGEGALEIVTDRVRLVYDRGPFTPAGLSAQVRGNISNYHSVWRYGEPVRDLGGTTRTLDGVDGRTALEPGIVSRVGVAVLDDSGSFVFEDDGWVSPRNGGGRIDVYVFAYGHDFAEALQAFYAVSGRQPVLPRWALGNWWSRYHRYSADSYLALLDRFAEERLPFSVAVLDMDWHRVDSVPEEYGSGWTGYSWEPSLFPDPEGFLAELHRRGLRVTLNVHPADGVRAFEDAYEAMAEALGRDAASGEPIAFDVTDRAFLEAYFSVLHHPLEDQGVDFWWLDWQQGPYSRIQGIDPLWMLNHFHFLDSGRDGRRPLTFSRYAGPGSHRYPVGFSGDTRHLVGVAAVPARVHRDRVEHRLRLVEPRHRRPPLGRARRRARDPVGAARRLLADPAAALVAATRSSSRSRGCTRARRATAMGDGAALPPPPRPVPAHDEPPRRGRGRAARAPDVPPRAVGAARLHGAQRVRVRLRAARRAGHDAARRGHAARRGARLAARRACGSTSSRRPSTTAAGRSSCTATSARSRRCCAPAASSRSRPGTTSTRRATPSALELLVAPGADGAFTLVEDDGTGTAPEDIRPVRTTITWRQAAGELTIGAADGPPGVLPGERTWTVTVLGTGRSETVSGPPDAALRVTVGADPAPRTPDRADALFDVLSCAQYGHEAKAAAWRTLTSDLAPEAMLAELHAQALPRELIGALSELLTARG